MTYTDDELERMLAEPESDLSERKEAFGGDTPTRVREAVCAFANDLPNHRRAGVVFIGACDDGSIQDVLRRIDEKLASHNRIGLDFTSGSTEARTQPYPIVALQQLVRNAVMHRTYEATSSPVRVYWYDDRIDILSPGGPYGVVTASNFGQPGVADYRNPNLAESLRVLGFVQRFGFGIAAARRALADNGNPPPHFTIEPNLVRAVIRVAG